MSIYRINPELLKSNGASDGDVLTYVASNAKIEWKAASGGSGDESNLYNTYTTLTANDYNSYTTLTANIYNTFAYLNANVGGGGGGNSAVNIISDQYTISTTNTFTLTKTVSDANNIIVSLDGIVQNPNDDYIVSGTTLTFNNTAPLPAGREVEVRHIVGGGDAANTWLNANDYVTYDTLTANIYNTFAYLNANVGGGGGDVANAWVNANDYVTFTTLTANIYNTFAYLNANSGGGGGDVANAWVNANDYATFTTLTANIYNTFAYLNANVGGGGTLANLVSDQYTISSSNTFTLTQTVIDANNIIVSVDGVIQSPNDDYSVFGTSLYLNNTVPIPAGITLEVRHLGSGLGGGGDASNTWVNANDFTTYTTLVGLINTVQNNVASGGGGVTTGKAVAMAIIFGG
jgi:hypothetical protein